MRRLAAAVAVVLAALLLPPAPASQASALPSKAVWLSDVKKAMAGSTDYLTNRVAARAPGEKLAIVLDIDNTSIATKYAWPEPVKVVRSFARLAVKDKVAVWFVTGRAGKQLRNIKQVLTKAGYTFAGVCGRRDGERLVPGKKRCRRTITAHGYTITANVGNRSTDFEGPNFEKAFALPNYGNALG